MIHSNNSMKFKILILTVLSIGLFLIFFEMVLRVVDYPKSEETISIGWTYLSNNPLEKNVNQYGFKGSEIPIVKKNNEKWFLLIGDSQIESLDLEDSLQLESLLRRKLNQEQDSINYLFFTIGTSGYGQDQQLIWMKQVLEKHSFDQVLLWFTPENDIWNNMFPTHWPWNGTPKPTFYFKENQLSLKLSEIKFDLKSKSKILNLIEKVSFNKKYSHLDDVWSDKYLPSTEKIFIDTSLSKKTNEWTTNSERVEELKTHLILYLEKDNERLQYGLDLTNELLDSMNKLCLEKDIKMQIIVAENQYFDNMYEGKWMYDHHSNKFLKISKNQYKKRLEDLLKPYSFRIFSLKTNNKQISETDTYHLNQNAQIELADSIQKWIVPSN